ncbi:hypothetical protein TNCT_584531 [Trichonephila clavata]|uniref:Uncharacterized protein n=1 Tax=Trichonephila clavata TaxID=2740835 RepID=A0A8X6H757_TRICU|nr:hypothetical protein TNCT_584531 [Trichonephila clavata]
MTCLYEHLYGKDNGEDVVSGRQDASLEASRGDGGPLHGQGDAVEGDEEQHGVIERFFRRDVVADLPEPARKRSAVIG